MKKYSLIKFASLILLLMSLQILNSQEISASQLNFNKNRDIRPELIITMEIDYSVWETGNWYEAIIFRDTDAFEENIRNSLIDKKDKDSLRRGRTFKSKVKRGQNLIWKAKFKKERKERIILISVLRNPQEGGAELLTQPWFNSEDGGSTIEGQTKQIFKGGTEERYVISFAIMNENNLLDIYTIDPLIKGSQ